MLDLRRHLPVTIVVTLSVQILALVLGVVRVCAEGPHRHGGVTAPDCTMHHHAISDSVEADLSHHHPAEADLQVGLSAPADVDSGATGARMTCRCSDDVVSTYLGENAVPEFPVVSGPAVRATPQQLFTLSAIDYRYTPPSPPPR